nr:tetratricopeptide repeat protein [Nannocystis sp. SCPEA4]
MTLVEEDRLDDAAEVQTRALALAEPRRRETPLEYARVANALASSRADQNRLDEAEALLRESLALRQQALGQHHPDVAVVLHNLGRVAVLRLDDEAALAYFRRALAIREHSLAPGHPGIAETLGGLGVASCRAGRDGECLALARKSLTLAEASHGPEDMFLVTPLMNLALELASRGEFVGAEAHLRRAEAIVHARGEQDSGDASWVFYNLGMVMRLSERPAEAIAPLQRALAVRERVFGPEHVEVGFAAALLGEVLAAVGRDAEAAPLLARARAIVAKNPSTGLEIVEDHLAAASLRWRRDREAGRALARVAADGLPLADPAEARRRIDAWLVEHPA